MKKVIKYLLVLMCIIPVSVFASTRALDLKDTLKEEQIEVLFDNYSETNEQVTVYLFRGSGCTHCHDFLDYLNEFAIENGKLFKLRSFEVYDNPDNSNLKKKVANYFGDKSNGVPYIIIGKETFYGFAKSDADEISAAIRKEYEASERFDIFDELYKEKTTSTTTKKVSKEKNENSFLAIIIMIVAIVVGIIIIASSFILKNKGDNKTGK